MVQWENPSVCTRLSKLLRSQEKMKIKVHIMFYLGNIKMKQKQIGEKLVHCCGCNQILTKVQTNFPSAYLIDVDNKDGGSCWGKASPQNESSFAYNVFFLVLSDSAKKLPKLMGQKTLLEYIKICNTYLMCWKHSSESTQNSKCTPLPIGISMWVTVGWWLRKLIPPWCPPRLPTLLQNCYMPKQV